MAVRQINVSGMIKEIFDFSKGIMPKATVSLANMWIETAHKTWYDDAIESGPWGKKYAKSLQVEEATSESGEARVFTEDDDPNALFVNNVENGIKSWNITDALLAGKVAAANAADGGVRYVRVPFRWRVPSKKPATSGFAGTMPPDVYAIAKSGGSIGQASNIATKQIIEIGGLQRYGPRHHRKYLTFRTVSENSKSPDWIYPQKAATPVFDKVVDKVERYIKESVKKLVLGHLKDLEKTFAK